MALGFIMRCPWSLSVQQWQLSIANFQAFSQHIRQRSSRGSQICCRLPRSHMWACRDCRRLALMRGQTFDQAGWNDVIFLSCHVDLTGSVCSWWPCTCLGTCRWCQYWAGSRIMCTTGGKLPVPWSECNLVVAGCTAICMLQGPWLETASLLRADATCICQGHGVARSLLS